MRTRGLLCLLRSFIGTKRLFSALTRFNKSRDGKTLVANLGYLTLLHVARYVFPFITIPYLARVIGVDGYGKIAFASAVVVWFQTVVDWGFTFTATRDVARCRDDVHKVSEIFSTVFWARVLLMMVSLVLLGTGILTIPIFRANRAILLMSFLAIPGHMLLPDWLFQAMERMKFITLFSVLSQALFTVLVFVFIKQKSDFLIQPLLGACGCAVSGVVAMYIISSRWGISLRRPNWAGIVQVTKESSDVFINNLFPNLYNSFSIVLLGVWGGPAANGKLQASRVFTGAAHTLLGLLSRTSFPYLARKIDKHGAFARLYLSIAACISLALFLAAPLLIRLLFTSEFYEATMALRITSISTVLVALSRVYGTNYLILTGHERALRNITIKASLIGFAISWPLVYYLDFIGAAITLTLSQAVLGLSIVNRALRIQKGLTQRSSVCGGG